MLAGTAGGAFRDEFNLPDVESKDGFDVLDEEFGGQGTGVVGTIVFRAEQGVDDPEVRRAMQELFADVEQIEDVNRGREPLRRGRRSPDEPRTARSPTPTSRCPTTSTSPRRGDPRRDPGEAPEIEGLQIELGGFIFAEFDEPSSEVLGLAFAIVILIVAFGSVLAMGLPVGVALFGIGIGRGDRHAAEQRPGPSPTSPRSSAS